MEASSWRRIDEYWAHELGLDPSPAELPPVSCTLQPSLPGVQVFRSRAGVVVASPARTFERLGDAISGRSPDEIFSPDWLRTVLGDTVERILGPAALHYADETSFRATTGTTARALSDSDSHSYHDFLGALGAEEVEESGVPAEIVHVYGAFAGDALGGVASYQDWRSVIAQIGVCTHPRRRRRGFAKQAVSALARDALDRGLILQWRALITNRPSMKLARAMGFEDHASTIFVRIRGAGLTPRDPLRPRVDGVQRG